MEHFLMSQTRLENFINREIKSNDSSRYKSLVTTKEIIDFLFLDIRLK